jgi:hypothetical protein
LAVRWEHHTQALHLIIVIWAGATYAAVAAAHTIKYKLKNKTPRALDPGAV